MATAKTRLILLGGFLGAGKTTTIARLAKIYAGRGRRVLIVTNDQAADLVDTHLLRAQGFEVGEVAGACFCCRFHDLIDVIGTLSQEQQPDVILAEPVGSCTDLVATVLEPLRQMYADRFEVAPFGVILKPRHGRRILRNEPRGGFSPQAAYIFRKQLEEADFILINRIDEQSPADVRELADLLRQTRPDTPVLRMSARTGEGFPALLEQLEGQSPLSGRALDIDYDVYAAGEAELGWLNTRLAIRAEMPFALDELLMDIVNHARSSLRDIEAETAHLKTIGLGDGCQGVANLISSDAPAELSLASNCQTLSADVIVNARVAVDPGTLAEHVATAVQHACRVRQASVEVRSVQQLRPGRPVPTYRMEVGGSDNAARPF